MGFLDGKVAIITGAANGIGAATARKMVREGARVVLADINESALGLITDELGSSVIGRTADITREQDIADLVDAALSTFGRLDILHNNAASHIAEDTEAANATDAAWQRTFEIVVLAAVRGVRHAVPAMIGSGDGGSIINMSSGASKSASATKAAYGACKSALETFSLYLGAQYGSEGIRSNVVRPGFVLTEGIRKIFDEPMQQQYATTSALGRLCLPEDVADVVAYLASPQAGYVNCAIVDVDGGGVKPTNAW